MVCNLFLRRFPRRDGSEITYIQYYQERFGIKITDLKQPLIVSMPTKQEQRKWGRTDPVYLIPEICNMTGLSDDQRANFKLMAAVGEYTRPTPPQRLEKLRQFSQAIQKKVEIAKELKDWGMKIDTEPVKFKARTMDPEKILQHSSKPALKYG